jgi:hypothetical protein
MYFAFAGTFFLLSIGILLAYTMVALVLRKMVTAHSPSELQITQIPPSPGSSPDASCSSPSMGLSLSRVNSRQSLSGWLSVGEALRSILGMKDPCLAGAERSIPGAAGARL